MVRTRNEKTLYRDIGTVTRLSVNGVDWLIFYFFKQNKTHWTIFLVIN